MAVTSENAVLILGAGSSAAFGLPLGGQFLTGVREQIRKEFDSFKQDHERGFAEGGQYGFWRRPVINTLQQAKRYEPDKLKGLGELLADQTSETIDDFIVENPSYGELTKLAMAAALYRCCHTEPTRECDDSRVRNFATRELLHTNGARRNWTHLFINLVRHGIRLEEVTPQNKVQVVTFNYDCILEHILDAQFSNTEKAYPDWRQYIEVTHVHGRFPDLDAADARVTHPAADICKWAAGIHVVHEGDVPAEVQEAREKARRLVASASEIYAAGFAFAGGNRKLLGLDQRSGIGTRKISYCNWNGDVGVRKSVEVIGQYEWPSVTIEEAKGTKDEPLEIEAWIRAGYLGETPA